MLVLLKVQSVHVQNGPRTIRFSYDSARLLNEPIWLQVTVHVNMNQHRTIYKRVGLTREQSTFLILKNHIYFWANSVLTMNSAYEQCFDGKPCL